MEKIDPNLESSKALFNHASIGILAINFDGHITMANPHLLKQFGYSTEEDLIGQKVEILIPQYLRQRHEKHRWDYDRHPQNRPMGIGMDLMGLRKDGTEFPVEISLAHYQINDERFALAFINDITLRKEIEGRILMMNLELEQKVKGRTKELSDIVQKLEQQIKETDAAQEKLATVSAFQKAIVDYAGVIIIATDEKGMIQLFNPEAERALEYSAKEIIGKYSPSIFHDPGEVAQRAMEFSAELGIELKAGFETFVVKSRFHLPNSYEWTYVSKSGRRIPVLLSITALRDSQGKIMGFLGIANDISKRKKAEEDLQKSLEKEKELSELKSRFVSMASHEFRTPLSTILSSAYLLSKYTGADDQLKRNKHIERIVSSVTMLTDTLNDFLSVGKIEEGKVQVKWKSFDLEESITSIVKEMQGISKKGQHISYRHTGDKMVRLDITLLKHIIMNLLSNAIKFSPEHSCIEVTTVARDEDVRISVKDKGMGISPEDQQNLFERFFRGSNAFNIQGTGLGLHIVKKYTDMMFGEITCISDIGTGTEFIINFQRHNHEL